MSSFLILRRQCERSILALKRHYTQSPIPSRTSGEVQIYDKLKTKFTPSQLEVQDVSGRSMIEQTIYIS